MVLQSGTPVHFQTVTMKLDLFVNYGFISQDMIISGFSLKKLKWVNFSVEKKHTEKFKCRNCGCPLWHLFGEEQNLIPMCTKCGSFTWTEPGEKDTGIRYVITYLIRKLKRVLGVIVIQLEYDAFKPHQE